ncbi:MAG: substrate-binding domain-containing protein, partial [Planctomycetes bacterium]|nr:substrate-binding domain-containing protein [Planctomycetota bacterium]
DEQVDSILSDNKQAIYKGATHLIKCGHENIVLLLEKRRLTTVEDRRLGYQQALEEYGIHYRQENVIEVDLTGELSVEMLKKAVYKDNATSFLAGGNTLTLRLLKGIREIGLECPREVSVVGYGDDNWFELVNPPLTTLTQDTVSLGNLAVETMLRKIDGQQLVPETTLVPVDLTIRGSTQNIARGPFGERAVYPEENTLTEEEIQRLREHEFTVAISFHYSDNEWTRLHEKAIRDTLSHYNIRLLSVADAHFDPKLQQTQLEGLLMQNPDAIIAVPTDEEQTSAKFREVAARTKLILINNMPQGMQPGDYAGWISINERENGQNAAKILIDHFAGREQVKVGLLVHGTPFFATKQRDFFAEQTIIDSGAGLTVAGKESFHRIDNAYAACERLMKKHPDISGLYITWDRPALKAIEALEEMGREDVVIVTTDLDYQISSYMARRKMVIGLSSQRPYEQGVAVAVLTAKALLGTNEYKCIGVQPYTVLAHNLEKAWLHLLKTKAPDFTSFK